MNVNRYSPLTVSGYIKLPANIENEKATINIKNDENKCFLYSLCRALDLNPKKNTLDRVSNHLKQVCINLGLDKLNISVSLKNIPKIEEKFNLDINIFGHIGGNIFPLGHIKNSGKKVVNILFALDEKISHYQQ